MSTYSGPRRQGSGPDWGKIGVYVSVVALIVGTVIGLLQLHNGAAPSSATSPSATAIPITSAPTDGASPAPATVGASPAPATVGASPAPTPATSQVIVDGATVFRTGSIALNNNDSVILDSTPPNWLFNEDCVTCDVWLENGLSAGPGGAIAVLSSPGNSYSACANDTQYESIIPEADVVTGMRVCVRTSQGRLALLALTEARRDSFNTLSRVTFTVTVWNRR